MTDFDDIEPELGVDYLSDLAKRSAEVGERIHASDKTLYHHMTQDQEAISVYEEWEALTVEQRESFDRLRAEWRDAGGRDL